MPQGPDKKRLWKIYSATRKMARDGLSEERINKFVQHYDVADLATLHKELGIEEDGKTSLRETIAGAAANIAQGAFLGAGDEIGGAIDAIIPGGRGYTEGRDRIRDREARFDAEHPKTGTALELAGMAVPMLATGGIAANAAGTGGLLARSIQGGATLGILCGAESAVYGGMKSEAPTLAGRGKDALLSGAVGGAIGAGAGVLGPPIAAIGRQALRAGEAVGIPGTQALRQHSAKRMAERELRGTLDAAGVSAEDVAKAVREMPEGSVVADYSEGIARKARAARNASDALDHPGGVVDNIRAREMGKGERVAANLRGGTGIERVGNPEEVLTAGKQIWRETMEEPFLIGMSDQTFGSMKIRRMLSENEMLGEALHRAGASVGDITQSQMIKVEDGWAAIQELDALLKPPLPGKAARLSVKEYPKAVAARDALVEIMEDAVPGFSEMRKGWADVNNRFRQYNAGRAARNRPERELRAEIAKAGDQAQAYREGLMDAYEEAFWTTPSNVNKLFGGSANTLLSKARHLFPEGSMGDRNFLNFVDNMANEGRWSRTYNHLKGGSSTAMQQTDELGAVITRMPSLVNEVISIFISDPHIRSRIGKELGEVLLAKGPDALIEAAIRAERAYLLSAASKGALFMGAARAGSETAQAMRPAGVLNTAPPMNAAPGMTPARGLLDYDMTQRNK